MVTQSDDIERLTRILVRMHQRDGQAAFLRQAAGKPASAIAKVCGATPEQVYAWETAALQPSTNQALAWLDALHAAPVPAELYARAAKPAAGRRDR